MSKEKEMMDFLHKNVFDPVLNSDASSCVKRGVRCTIMRLERLNAEKMRQYFWSAVMGTDRSDRFYQRLSEEGLPSFESVLVEFRNTFTDEWLAR